MFTLTVGFLSVGVFLNEDMGDYGEYTALPHPKVVVNSIESPGFQLTLLHELLHAIDDVYDIGLSEQGVRILEQSLGALVRDNPVHSLAWTKALCEANEDPDA